MLTAKHLCFFSWCRCCWMELQVENMLVLIRCRPLLRFVSRRSNLISVWRWFNHCFVGDYLFQCHWPVDALLLNFALNLLKETLLVIRNRQEYDMVEIFRYHLLRQLERLVATKFNFYQNFVKLMHICQVPRCHLARWCQKIRQACCILNFVLCFRCLFHAIMCYPFFHKSNKKIFLHWFEGCYLA